LTESGLFNILLDAKRREPGLRAMIWLLIFALSYLIGSIPSGYLVARSKGIDICRHGSSNIGAANVARVMGKKWGYLVGLCDFLKGFLAAKLGFLIASHFLLSSVLGSVIAAIASILGHNYTVWLGFKGGKGIATSGGAVLALFPPVVFVSAGVVWLAVFFISRFTSLASMSAALALPIAVLLIGPKTGTDFWLLIGSSVLMTALAIWRHRGNIVRLLNGTENRFGKK
jgi:acyl phosphate:glycerol-3-phosphate acyltransferase